METQKALRALTNIVEECVIVAPNPDTYPKAIELIQNHNSSADKVFDAYLAATALTNGISAVATDNVKDFAVFDELEIMNPFG